MKHTLSAAAVLGLLGAVLPGMDANASIVTYSGMDSGAPTSGPFPNSAAAQSSFIAAAGALGPLNTITFEGLPTGGNSPIAAAPGVSIALTGFAYGCDYTGICNTTFGNLDGFNTTPGGNEWLGFSTGTATFSFANGTQSFGLYLTGLQTIYTTPGLLTVNFSDGASQSLDPPVTVNGGAEYFGFTDQGADIASITISNLTDDAWGVDDVTYNVAPTTSTGVPEPFTLSLFGAGLIGAAALRRRKKNTA